MNTNEFICNNLSEVKEATSQLDKAILGKMKIDVLGVEKEINSRMGVFNMSKGHFCESVVPHYNLVQHKDYFDAFATALDRLNLKYTMTIKQSGDRAFANIDFIDNNVKFENLNEEFTTGIRLCNSYNKSRGLLVAPRYTRLACTNGMILTRTEKVVSIKHHEKIVSELESFVETKLNSIINNNEDLKKWVSNSMEDSIEWLAVCNIISKLYKQLKHREEILKRLNIEIIINKDEKTKKKTITYQFNDKENKNKKISRWDIYNAITNYISFGEQITPHIEDHMHRLAERLLITQLAKMPQ